MKEGRALAKLHRNVVVKVPVIREGLKAGEKVVVTANFLIDAESNLRAALKGFTADSPTPPAASETKK